MRVLLDECLPRKLKSELAEHDVRTAQEEGWAGWKNGALLHAAILQGLRIAVIAILAKSNRLGDLRTVMAQVREALSQAKPGAVLKVGG